MPLDPQSSDVPLLHESNEHTADEDRPGITGFFEDEYHHDKLIHGPINPQPKPPTN